MPPNLQQQVGGHRLWQEGIRSLCRHLKAETLVLPS